MRRRRRLARRRSLVCLILVIVVIRLGCWYFLVDSVAYIRIMFVRLKYLLILQPAHLLGRLLTTDVFVLDGCQYLCAGLPYLLILRFRGIFLFDYC